MLTSLIVTEDPQEATAMNPGTAFELRPALLEHEETTTLIWIVTTLYRCVVPHFPPLALAPANQRLNLKKKKTCTLALIWKLLDMK